jgi:glyoxylase-like metal-dependent hydrolase (beta-lactamase superfamily II)
MNLGKFDIDVIDTGIFALDGGAMFGIIPKALWSKAYSPGDELNRIPLAARLMLVRYENRIILVDTGNGTKLDPKIAGRFGIDLDKSSLDNALKPFKLNPEQITDVILTHLHFDHAGGATKLENGKIVPTFPNAKYYVQKEQYDWAVKPSEKDKASYFQENYVPLKNEGILELIDGDGVLFPGISLTQVNGHTKSMQVVKIEDDGKSMLFCADLSPTSAHVPAHYVMGYDNFPLQGIEEKKRIFAQVYEEGTIVVYEHDAFKQATKVLSTEKGFSAGEEIVITKF